MRLNCYLANSSDSFIQVIRESDSGKSSHSMKRITCRFNAQLRRSLVSDDKSQSLHKNASISVEGSFEQAPETDAKHYRTCCSSLRVRSWSGKLMHGQYRRRNEQPPVNMKKTYGWIKAANIPAATEGLVVAAQDQALRNQDYEGKILHRDISSTYGMCSVGLETVDHIVASCSALAQMDYTDRHNQVTSIIHFDVFRHFGVPVESRWYRHHSDRLVEKDDITMMWDTTIFTAKKIKANRSDICLRYKKTNTSLLIDTS